MNNIPVCHTRNRNESKMFSSINFPLTNYSSDAQSKTMKNTLGDTMLPMNINKLHLIPDPLKKNLADSVITGTMKQKKDPDVYKKPSPATEPETRGSLGGFTNFLSGVFNTMTGMFQKRTSSPTTQYYDCFDAVHDSEFTPSLVWTPSNFEGQNKNTVPNTHDTENMSITNCKEKLNQIRLLLNGNVQNCPTQIYNESRSLEDSFEDAFCPENIVRLANEQVIECYNSYNHHEQELLEADAPVIKTEFCTKPMAIVNNEPINEVNVDLFDNNMNTATSNQEDNEIVLTCEDKLKKLKDLMQCKCKQNSKMVEETKPIPINKVKTSSFDNEISPIEKEVKNSFNEVNGRFYSSSQDSDDSFQIVFADRKCIPSDCESEDSFILFEESPDCYTNNDVFGSESESETEDSVCIMTGLNHSFSRTFEDLTDDSLYGADEVDCTMQLGESVEAGKEKNSNKTINKLVYEKKQDKNQKPNKKVRFSTDPPKVHVMRVWAFAARQARAGHWERYTLDRNRFKRRIADVEMAISWVLKPQHRTCVMFQRFMPWWNAQKRQELSEKKGLQEKENPEIETQIDEETTEIESKLKEEALQNSVLKENDPIVKEALPFNGIDCMEENITDVIKNENDIETIQLAVNEDTDVNAALCKETESTQTVFRKELELQENITDTDTENLGDVIKVTDTYEMARMQDDDTDLKINDENHDQQEKTISVGKEKTETLKANVEKGIEIDHAACTHISFQQAKAVLHDTAENINTVKAEDIEKRNNLSNHTLNIFSAESQDSHENYNEGT